MVIEKVIETFYDIIVYIFEDGFDFGFNNNPRLPLMPGQCLLP